MHAAHAAEKQAIKSLQEPMLIQDEFVDHDVVPDNGVNQLLVEGSFLVMK